MKKVLEKLNPFKVTLPFTKEKGYRSLSSLGEQTQYDLVQDSNKTKALFARLRHTIASLNEATRSFAGGTAKYRFEWGHLSEGREFFYLQPWNEEGLLFEQAHKGWIISRAHKVPQSSQFMRQSASWDVVTVFVSGGGEFLRLSSSRFGDELVSFLPY